MREWLVLLTEPAITVIDMLALVIVVFSNREIGQPALAAVVAFSQAAVSAFGTFPFTAK